MNTYASSFGADAVTYGPGEASLSHTTNEKVDIREIFACAKIIVDATKELFEINEKSGNSIKVE
jgi:acetylornithine deacetylase/succinyl-diaminopimelate desuccinylase-like protein